MNLNLWKEYLSEAAHECKLTLTDEQLTCLAKCADSVDEHRDLISYTPPATDRYIEIEREWKKKYENLERQHAQYQQNAEEAVKIALRLRRDDNISIREGGGVERFGGRTEIIQ